MADLIDRAALLVDIDEAFVASGKSANAEIRGAIKIIDRIKAAPAVDTVSRELFSQIYWERDVAIAQLEEHGMTFGAKAPDVVRVIRCKDCLYYTLDNMSPGSGWCESLERAEYDSHYCNYARRKDCGNCKRRYTCEPFHRKNIGVALGAGVYFTNAAIIGTTQEGGNLSLNWCDKWEREL